MNRDGDYGWNDAHALLAARIAELEAERDGLYGENDRLRDVRDSRIAELEAAHMAAIEKLSNAVALLDMNAATSSVYAAINEAAAILARPAP